MGVADIMLLSLLGLADLCLFLHLRRRRRRSSCSERMMRSLRRALRREVGMPGVTAPVTGAFVLQRAG